MKVFPSNHRSVQRLRYLSYGPLVDRRHDRGVVLLAAIAVLVLLAISSAAYLQLASLDRQMGESSQPEMDVLQSAIISKLEVVLANDMDFANASFHDDGKDWWDYPYTNPSSSFEVSLSRDPSTPLTASGGKWDDMWLASTVMDFDLNRDGADTTDDYGWRHVSNLEGIFLRVPRRLEADKESIEPYEYAVNTNGATPSHITDTDVTYLNMIESVFASGTTDQKAIVTNGEVTTATNKYGADTSAWPDQWWFEFDRSNALITAGDELDLYEPLGTDADGDGVPDSIWTWAPIRSLGAYSYIAAYRVVDLSSMIPVNSLTASRTVAASAPGASIVDPVNEDRDRLRGYFPNHLDMQPLMVAAVDTNGDPYSDTEVLTAMRRVLGSYGFDADADGEATDTLPLENGILSLKSDIAGPEADITDNEYDRYPYKGGSASDHWYQDGGGTFNNTAEYFSQVVRTWGEDAPYGSTENTYELLYRFGLNRDTVNTTAEEDLGVFVRSSSASESSYQDVVGSVDTRGDLIKWFIGDTANITPTIALGEEHTSTTLGRDYYDLRKMLTAYSGGLKIRSPIVETNPNVIPTSSFSLNSENRPADVDNSHPFYLLKNENDQDEMLDFFTDWYGVVADANGWWHGRLEQKGDEDQRLSPRVLSRQMVNNIGDYYDKDSAQGEIDDKYYGLERLPRIGEAYFQQAMKLESGNWVPLAEDDHQIWVFELRNPFMQPITVRDLNGRNDGNDDERFEIMVSRHTKNVRDKAHPQWVFTPYQDMDGSVDFWGQSAETVVIPPDGVAFFIWEQNPSDEHDVLTVAASGDATISGTGGTYQDLNLPDTDKYGRTIKKISLTTSAQDVNSDDTEKVTQGVENFKQSVETWKSTLYVHLKAPGERNSGNSKRRTFDRLHHYGFKLHASYPTTATLPEGTIQNIQMSIARDCRGRRYLANTRNDWDLSANSWQDQNIPVKMRLLPGVQLDSNWTTNRYPGSFISNRFCTVDNTGDIYAAGNGYNIPSAGALAPFGGLIHQLGRNVKAIDTSGSNFLRLADPGSWPDVDKWEAALDSLQLSNPGHPMLSDTELALIPPFHVTRQGRGDHLVTSEILGDPEWTRSPTNDSDDSYVDPRLFMWNFDYSAAYLGFDTSAAYVGSKVTVAPPGATLMEYLDVLALGDDDKNNDSASIQDDIAELVIPYRININTAPLHVMTLACPIAEPHPEIEALFRQIERFRDGVDGGLGYDGVAGPTLTTVKDVRAAMTGLPADAYDGQKAEGLPGVKSLSELIWMNPGQLNDPSQDPTVAHDHITNFKWGDMQRYGYDGINNANTPIDNYPYDADYSALTAVDNEGTYSEDRDGDGTISSGETFDYVHNGSGGIDGASFLDTAIDDNEERLHRYQYLTGTYSTRSDYFVLYAFFRAYESGKFSNGPVASRRFMAVFDRHLALTGGVRVVGGATLVR